MKCQTRVRYFKSKVALAVLLWNSILMSSLSLPHTLLSRLEDGPSSSPAKYWLAMMLIATFYMLYFVFGLIADLCCGRARMISVSLWITWIGVILNTIHESIFTQSHVWPFSVVCIAFMYIGRSGFQANVVQFGSDQLNDPSSDELSSFISWVIWSERTGYVMGVLLSSILMKLVPKYSITFLGLALSVGFCLAVSSNTYLTQRKLLNDPMKQYRNPYGTICSVLWYAMRHRFPERRSALTYWEEGIPSRIDLGKRKYGGPFSVEEVEGVKTLGRLVIILLTSSIILVPFSANFKQEELMLQHFEKGLGTEVMRDLASNANNFIIILVPLYEFALRPLLRRYTTLPLKTLLFATFLLSVSLILNLTISLVGHITTHENMTCIFNTNLTQETDNSTLLLSPTIVPILFYAVGYTIAYVTIMKFLLAQSPQDMKGMLIGLFYSLWGLSMLIGLLLILPFHFYYPGVTKPEELSCGSAYLLLLCVIDVLGMVAAVLAASKYKYRERDEVLGNEHQFAVDYYERAVFKTDVQL